MKYMLEEGQVVVFWLVQTCVQLEARNTINDLYDGENQEGQEMSTSSSRAYKISAAYT